jgi:hypothetical protein
MVWAALDCPSWYGAARGAPALLGMITAHCVRPLGVDVPVVVSGWGVRRDGRKTMAGLAIHSVDGEPLALAAATWIHPREHARQVAHHHLHQCPGGCGICTAVPATPIPQSPAGTVTRSWEVRPMSSPCTMSNRPGVAIASMLRR